MRWETYLWGGQISWEWGWSQEKMGLAHKAPVKKKNWASELISPSNYFSKQFPISRLIQTDLWNTWWGNWGPKGKGLAQAIYLNSISLFYSNLTCNFLCATQGTRQELICSMEFSQLPCELGISMLPAVQMKKEGLQAAKVTQPERGTGRIWIWDAPSLCSHS